MLAAQVGQPGSAEGHIALGIEVHRREIDAGAPVRQPRIARPEQHMRHRRTRDQHDERDAEQAVQPPQQLETEQQCVWIQLLSESGGQCRAEKFTAAARLQRETKALGAIARDHDQQNERFHALEALTGSTHHQAFGRKEATQQEEQHPEKYHDPGDLAPQLHHQEAEPARIDRHTDKTEREYCVTEDQDQRTAEQQSMRDTGPAPLFEARGQYTTGEEGAPVDVLQRTREAGERGPRRLAVRDAPPMPAQAESQAAEGCNQQQSQEQVAEGRHFRHGARSTVLRRV